MGDYRSPLARPLDDIDHPPKHVLPDDEFVCELMCLFWGRGTTMLTGVRGLLVCHMN